jgi:hypothetical protein
MERRAEPGQIHLIAGPMFSGKTWVFCCFWREIVVFRQFFDILEWILIEFVGDWWFLSEKLILMGTFDILEWIWSEHIRIIRHFCGFSSSKNLSKIG